MVLRCGVIAVQASDEGRRRDLLSVHLALTKQEAQNRLKDIGVFERDEPKQQEIWEIKDERFSHVIVGFDKGEKLRPVTAVAREDQKAKRVRSARSEI